jgi:anti-anti-sigma regulatory factor
VVAQARVQIQTKNDVIHVTLFGDMQPKDLFERGAFFEEIASISIENKSAIFVDFRGMQFMNSTSIFAIIQFIRTLAANGFAPNLFMIRQG